MRFLHPQGFWRENPPHTGQKPKKIDISKECSLTLLLGQIILLFTSFPYHKFAYIQKCRYIPILRCWQQQHIRRISMFRRVFHKVNTFIRFLISYLLILSLCILGIGGIYASMSQRLIKQNTQTYVDTIQTITEQMDRRYENIQTICTMVLSTAKVQELAGAQTISGPERTFDVISVIDQLRLYKNAGIDFQNLYIYFNNSKAIISTSTMERYLDVFYSIQYNSISDTGYSQWLDTFQESHSIYRKPTEVSIIPGQNGLLQYAHTIYEKGTDTIQGTLVIDISLTSLQEEIAALLPDERISLYVLDCNNQPIYSLRGTDETQLSEEWLKSPGMVSSQRVNGQKTTIAQFTSFSTGWKYVALIPDEALNSELNRFYAHIMAALFCILLLGVAISFVLAKKAYLPIQSLVSLLPTKHAEDFSSASNEYDQIAKSIQATLDENERINAQLNQYQQNLYNQFFGDLMRGGFTDWATAADRLSQAGLDLDDKPFLVISFVIEDADGFFRNAEQEDRDRGLIHLILQNIYEELFSKEFVCSVGSVENITTCLIALPDRDSNRMNHLISVAANAKKIIEERFEVYFSTAISDFHQGIPHIQEAYWETQEALRYKFLFGRNEIILYEEIKDRNGESFVNNSYFQNEKLFCNYLLANDYDNARRSLKLLMEVSFYQDDLSIQFLSSLKHGLIIRFIGTIQNILSDHNSFNRETLREMEARLLEPETADALQDSILRIIDFLEGMSDASNESSCNLEAICNYVQEHYFDPSINVTAVAEHFGVNLTKLSKDFKQSYGEGLLHYINKYRIMKAKELLRNEELSIREISKQVGFANDAAMIRVFKTYEGITPGKYRELL